MAVSGLLAVLGLGAAALAAVVLVLVLVLGRRKHDWAGEPTSQQPQEPRQPPRSIDDSQRFRQQNRPTDPPPPA
jgi:hypothetical protein